MDIYNIPAFPLSRNSIQADNEGMTLRDYFAAHAPQPQSWYKPNMDDLVNPSLKAEDGWQDQKIEYDREYERRRHVCWPYTYAEAMIKERNKK